jgi:hypothetical protein
MLERNKENEGIRLWGMTPAQMTQVLAICDDGDRLADVGVKPGDSTGALNVLFDPLKGYDLTVSFKKPGEKGNLKTFTLIDIKGKIKSSPLAKDQKAADELVRSCKDIKELFSEVSSAEVKRLFAKKMGAGGSEAVADGGVEKYAEPPKANMKENAKLVGTRSIDDAFGDMLADDDKAEA